MPRYDFICKECQTIRTVERAIRNRNRAPTTCREVLGLGEEECGGKYKRIYTPINIRIAK